MLLCWLVVTENSWSSRKQPKQRVQEDPLQYWLRADLQNHRVAKRPLNAKLFLSEHPTEVRLWAISQIDASYSDVQNVLCLMSSRHILYVPSRILRSRITSIESFSCNMPSNTDKNHCRYCSRKHFRGTVCPKSKNTTCRADRPVHRLEDNLWNCPCGKKHKYDTRCPKTGKLKFL